jgi:hypothetical protein
MLDVPAKIEYAPVDALTLAAKANILEIRMPKSHKKLWIFRLKLK